MNVILNNSYEKGVCQCRSCNHIFHQSEVKRVHRECLGQTVIEAVCPNPNCGSNKWGLMKFTYRGSIENVYKTDKFLNMK